MKVLKPGRPQKGWSKESLCTGAGNGDGGCGALLLVEQADLFITTSSHYDGSNDEFVTFKCGECGVLTDIDGVPTNIKMDLPRKKPL
jgi:hypothetical protein